jgi:hypothetical protein
MSCSRIAESALWWRICRDSSGGEDRELAGSITNRKTVLFGQFIRTVREELVVSIIYSVSSVEGWPEQLLLKSEHSIPAVAANTPETTLCKNVYKYLG